MIYQGSEIRLIVDLDSETEIIVSIDPDHATRADPGRQPRHAHLAHRRSLRDARPHGHRRCHQHRLRRGRGHHVGRARRRRRRRRRGPDGVAPRAAAAGGGSGIDRRKLLIGGGVVAAGARRRRRCSRASATAAATAAAAAAPGTGEAGGGLGQGAERARGHQLDRVHRPHRGRRGRQHRPLPGGDRHLGQLLRDLERQQRGLRQGVRRLPRGRQPHPVGHRHADLLAGVPRLRSSGTGWRRSRTTSSRTT